eukprot:gnl/MRDRNA2_/MRDRNA2_180037_c0_seq1.p1 gnl/MRDRNA2_/MRDRNA2_180037_c0~~gnl/MRDRNA2_/MRDRNA2_180037_c0_seq1.p1  ORF type:complete len:440 (-),score=58.51 gnl/MRDRNA2_/MRDRNA2_180037_c0_seq1:60-1244(-)
MADGKLAGRIAETITLPDSYLYKHDPETWAIVERIHAAARVPVGLGEYIEVTRYKPGGLYSVHSDDLTGKRGITALLSLRGEEAGMQGGEVVFPFAYGNFRDEANNFFGAVGMEGMRKLCPQESQFRKEDAESYLKFSFKRGHAFIFHSHLSPELHVDSSLHGVCPVQKGEKWIMQRWIHFPPTHPRIAVQPGSLQQVLLQQQLKVGSKVWVNVATAEGEPDWRRAIIRRAYVSVDDEDAGFFNLFDVEFLWTEAFPGLAAQMYFRVPFGKLWPRRSNGDGPPSDPKKWGCPFWQAWVEKVSSIFPAGVTQATIPASDITELRKALVVQRIGGQVSQARRPQCKDSENGSEQGIGCTCRAKVEPGDLVLEGGEPFLFGGGVSVSCSPKGTDVSK